MMIHVICVTTISFFFFSSRRRHTRCSRDWSSDVCSSDLVPGGDLLRRLHRVRNRGGVSVEHTVDYRLEKAVLRNGDVRSEEHTSELQSRLHLVCRLLLEKKK